MKHHQQDPFGGDLPEPSLEQQLTDYLMGEADAATIARVEAALAEDASLRTRREQLTETLGLLKAKPIAAPAALDPARRAFLRQEAARALQGGAPVLTWWRRPGLRAAAVLILAGALVGLWQPWQGPSMSPPAADRMATLSQAKAAGEEEAAATAAPGEASPALAERDAIEEVMVAPQSPAAPQPAAESSSPMPLDTLGYAAPSGGGGAYHGAGDVAAPNLESSLLVMPEPVLELATVTPESTWSEVSPAPTARSAAPGLLGNSPSSPKAADKLAIDDARQDAQRTRRFSGFQDEDRIHFKRGQEDLSSSLVIDGYGRGYDRRHVMDYLHRHGQERPTDMFFRYYGDNPAVLTATQPMSTFSADVDSASYALTRAYLVDGQLPPKAAVRTEEFLNYFDYDLPKPEAGEDFGVLMQAAPSAFSREPRELLAIGIKAREIAAEARPPMNLVFVIDKSGSMAGERMQLVKDALELVIDQLHEDDTLGLVTFDSVGHVVQEPIAVRERWKLRQAVRLLSTGGSTNAGEGLELGYRMIEKVYDPERINRVILASDGVANTGETDQQRILQQVKARAEAEVDLTTLGVGMGNHNDVFLEQLADQGDGSCHYLDDFAEAKRVLVDQFLGTLVTVGRELKIQVEFDPAVVQRWRQLGYENRSLTAAQFRDDQVDAGEVGSGQDVMALYELDLMPEVDATSTLATVRLRWIPEGAEAAVEKSFRMTVGEASTRFGLAPKALRLAAVAGQLAEVLRHSWHARGDDRDRLLSESALVAKEWPQRPEVQELADMVRRALSLMPQESEDELAQLIEEARQMQLRLAEIESLRQGSEEGLLEALRQQNANLEAQLQELLQGR